MKKEKTKQANYRLPESLLRDLKFVSEHREESQTEIVETAVQSKVARLKKNILQQRERQAEAALA